MANPLFEWGEATSGHAPVLIHHLWGALDAGDAAQLAIAQLQATLKTRRVATFDVDSLIDYRSRRPVASMDDWTIATMDGPELVIDEVTDYSGQHFLLLHGPEPDFKWDAFVEAVAQISDAFGVTTAVTMMGMPAGVPHTRSTFVHTTATNADDVPTQPGSMQVRMTASANLFIEYYLGQHGIRSLGLVAGVPYYLADREYPHASAALMNNVSKLTDLTLPIGDLEAAATQIQLQLDKHIHESEELSQLVQLMEQRYDKALENEPVDPGFFNQSSLGDEEPSGDVLAEQIEEFLKGQTTPVFPPGGAHATPPAALFDVKEKPSKETSDYQRRPRREQRNEPTSKRRYPPRKTLRDKRDE